MLIDSEGKGPVFNFVAWWFGVGFFLLLVGLYLFPSRNTYRAIFYILFLLPSLGMLVLNAKKALKTYFKAEVVLFAAFLFYLTLSALWGDLSDFFHYAKRAIVILVSGYGIYFFQSRYPKAFNFSCCLAIVVASCIGGLWLVDSYWLNGNPIGTRLFNGSIDYLGLYEERHYAGFYNPLLFSHSVTFFLTLLPGMFFIGEIKSIYLKIALILSGVILFVSLIVAQTRMAWLLVFLVYSAIAVMKWRYKGMAIAICIFVTLMVLFLQIDHNVVNRGFSYRPKIWLDTLKQMSGYWLFGHGMGAAFEIKLKELGFSLYDPHNIYLSILYYSGICGLLSLTFLAVKMLRGLRAVGSVSPWFVLWAVHFTFSGLADGGGLLSHPTEHWFSFVLPLLFLLAHLRCQFDKGKIRS